MSLNKITRLESGSFEASVRYVWSALQNLRTLEKVTLLASSCTFGLFVSFQYYLLRIYSKYITCVRTEDDTKVSFSLWNNFFQVARIALPTWRCREFVGMVLFVCLFALKAIVRVQLSKVNGQVLASMLHGKESERVVKFIQRISMRAGLSLALALSNGAIEGLRPWLIATFRKRLISTFQRRFYRRLIFYQATVLDHRLEAVDTALATYCGQFAEHFAELPYYFVLPGLECITSSYALIQQSGVRTASIMGGIMTAMVLLLRWLSPRFGRIQAVLLSREDDYRRMLTSNLYNVENIAMYGSAIYTRRRLETYLMKLEQALDHMALARGNYATLETLFSSMLSIMANIAAFDGTRRQYFQRPIDQVYLEIQLLEELNCSVKDFVVNFRELSHLTEFAGKMAEFDNTLRSVTQGVFMRDGLPVLDTVNGGLSPTEKNYDLFSDTVQLSHMNGSTENEKMQGNNVYVSPTSSPRVYTNICTVDNPTKDDDGNVELINVHNVLLESPAGQVLLRNLNFTMKSNEDWVITGVNGSGKTSFLRMLAGLWLPTSGEVCLAREVELLFAPQHSYMIPQCTLYEQICFPKEAPQPNNEIRKQIMESIDLAGAQTVVSVIGGEDSPVMGFDLKCVDESYDWSSLSGGQKQRISMARIFFHVLRTDRHKKTPIAILDEATSMMDETEQDVLNNLRRLNVRMLSVTHRETVVRHHTNVLRITHNGAWMHEKVVNTVQIGELVEVPEVSYEQEVDAHGHHTS